jgi:predicted acetyltransferase
MDSLKLVFPRIGHEPLWRDFTAEFETAGEKFSPGALSGYKCYGDFLSAAVNMRNAANLPPHLVPESTYFCMDEQESNIFGAVSIRHSLNQALLHNGGNIGYGVKPSERRKGCATKMLELALGICGNMDMDKVLIICNKNNTGSRRVILKNGGVMEDERVMQDGGVIQRYWIALNAGKPDGSA